MEQLNSKVGEQGQQQHHEVWSYERQTEAIHLSSDQHHNYPVQHPLDAMGNKKKMGTSDLYILKQWKIITGTKEETPGG